jgi:hypothetical protein
MRKLALALSFLAGAASPAFAQAPMPWNTELGIRATIGQTDVDGTGLTTIQLPAGGGYQGFGSGSALYAVFPVGGGRLAIEPAFSYSDVSLGTNIVQMNAAGRLMISAWRGLYIGVGPTVTLVKADGDEEARFGMNVGAGWRFPVGGVVTGRAEAFYESVQEGESFAPVSSSTIGLSLGLGMAFGDRPTSGNAANDALWELALGIQGGYNHMSDPGNFDLAGFTLPGSGSNLGLAGFPVQAVNPWFVVIPVGRAFAVEPSFSYQSYSIEDDAGSGSAYSIGVKGNYAFNRTVYAGLSAEYAGFGGDDFDGVDGTTGVGAQVGLRFPLIERLRGRLEMNYRTFSGGDNSLVGDYQAYGFNFGVTAPLN